MKMNNFWINLFLVSLMIFQSISRRTCNTDLLRSLGYHGRVIPNRLNAVCSNIVFNCCTIHDQMKIHKQWQNFYKRTLAKHYFLEKKAFKQFLTMFVMTKESIDLYKITKKFQMTKFGKNGQVIGHLKKLAKVWHKKPIKTLKLIKRTIEQYQPRFVKTVKSFRKSFFCSVCNWKNHQYINTQSMQIVMTKKYCLRMKRMFMRLWQDKYSQMFKLALVLDEYVFLVSHKRLIRFRSDRAILHKYIILMKKCKKNPNHSMCDTVCEQYNFNKFTYFMDGEGAFIKDFIVQFGKIRKMLLNERKLKQLFEMRKNFFLKNVFRKTVSKYTVLGNRVIPKPKYKPWEKEYKKKKTKKHSIANKTSLKKRVIQRNHPWSSIQLEPLDDAVSSYQLYRIKNNPIDISEFKIKIGGLYGVDPFKDRKNMNLEVSVHKFLGLTSHSKSDPNSLNEIIEKDVKDMLKVVTISRISQFVEDHMLIFDQIKKN